VLQDIIIIRVFEIFIGNAHATCKCSAVIVLQDVIIIRVFETFIGNAHATCKCALLSLVIQSMTWLGVANLLQMTAASAEMLGDELCVYNTSCEQCIKIDIALMLV